MKNLKNDSIAKEMSVYQENNSQCKKCGRKKSFYYFEKKEFKICDWCGNKIYKNDEIEKKYKQIEFKNKMKKLIEG